MNTIWGAELHPGACINGWRLGSKTYGIGRKRRRKVHRE